MLDFAQVPPDSLVDDLTTSLWQSRAALRSLARRKAWEPSIGDCRAIAERQVEHLRRVGVERIVRRVAPPHNMGGKDRGWQDFLRDSASHLEELHSTIMLPAPHSPLK
jgi:hypothetical protein